MTSRFPEGFGRDSRVLKKDSDSRYAGITRAYCHFRLVGASKFKDSEKLRRYFLIVSLGINGVPHEWELGHHLCFDV